MKRFFASITFITMVGGLFAQSPEKISYQAVVRNSSNQLVTNHAVGMKISILKGTVTGTAVYIETQTPTTNVNGLVTLEIGDGTVISGAFASIDWSDGPYFIKTETDPTGGTNYTIIGTSQLLSVPYALLAKKVEYITETDPVYMVSPAASITASDITKLGNLSGINTGDQDVSAMAHTNRAALDAVTGINTGDQDGSETKLNAGTNVTIIGNGTAVNPYVINANEKHYIGELYGGGIVLWVSPDGQHGLIMSLVDVSTNAAWSNITNIAVECDDLYDGFANSNAIVAQVGHTTSAAKLCLDYSNGGFDDWFLPSSWQLSQIHHNAYTLNYVFLNDGNAATVPLVTNQNWSPDPLPIYWSSTENDSGSALNQNFQVASSNDYNKALVIRVRAVRAF